MKGHYAGVGSRQTPQHMLHYFTRLAVTLEFAGYVLRSGGAPGADTAFECGANKKQVFLPWRGFNDNTSPLHSPPTVAFDIASQFHPAWGSLSPTVRKFMARNAQQVLGPNCDDPSKFVVCWTIGANGKGGTGQAIRIALEYDIPVFDFGDPKRAHRDLQDYLNRR